MQPFSFSQGSSLDLVSSGQRLLCPAIIHICQGDGLKEIRFHDLRHTAASLMLNYAIPVIIVSRRLGHARVSITMDVHGRLIPSRQEEAASLMDRLMKTDCGKL